MTTVDEVMDSLMDSVVSSQDTSPTISQTSVIARTQDSSSTTQVSSSDGYKSYNSCKSY